MKTIEMIKDFIDNVSSVYEEEGINEELATFMILLENHENVDFHTLRIAANPLTIPLRMEEADELHLLIWELYNSPAI